MKRAGSIFTALIAIACAACSRADEPSDATSNSVSERTPRIDAAVARTSRTVDGQELRPSPNPGQQIELVRVLAALSDVDGSTSEKRQTVRCMYNCPPPIGSVTASPQVVDIPADGMGTTTIHWRWDQADLQAITTYSCLWVSAGDEPDVHAVQCERPGHNYATTLHWIGGRTYTFRVAPGNLKGPFTRPLASIYQFAQTTVVGIGAPGPGTRSRQ